MGFDSAEKPAHACLDVCVIAALLPAAMFGADFQYGDTKVSVGARVTVGTAIRMEDPDPLLVPTSNGPTSACRQRRSGRQLRRRQSELPQRRHYLHRIKGVATIGISHDT